MSAPLVRPGTHGGRLVAVGDLMLGRTFEAFSGSALSLLSPEVDRLLVGDVVTGNLECLVTEATKANPRSHSAFRADAAFARPLVQRFHVLTMANNHVYDYFDEGIDDTLRFLEDCGVAVVGVGRTSEDALAPALFRVADTDVAVFGLTTTVPEFLPGAAFTVGQPSAAAYARIRQAHEQGALVVVHLHAGGGDLSYPAPDVRQVQDRLLAAGASVVLGHHPHCPQGWTVTGEHAQFFSLGDFVFDRFEQRRDEALVVSIPLHALADTHVQPVVRRPDFVVDLPDAPRAAALEAHLQELNHALAQGTSDEAFFRHSAALGRIQREAFLRALRRGEWRMLARQVRRVGWRRVLTVLRTVVRSLVPTR